MDLEIKNRWLYNLCTLPLLRSVFQENTWRIRCIQLRPQELKKRKRLKKHIPPPLRSQCGVLTIERCRPQRQRSQINASEVNSLQKGLRTALKIAMLRLPGPPSQKSSLAQRHRAPEAGPTLAHPSPLEKARLHKSHGFSSTSCHSQVSEALL